MYCKIYIHCDKAEKIISLMESRFGRAERKISFYYFSSFDITLDRNDESDRKKMNSPTDGFLYYELLAELEIYTDHIRITDEIMRLLHENDIPAVVSCDYEDELEAPNTVI